MNYYAGLPSRPRLVARTSTTPWKMPSGPEAYHVAKQLGVVGKHKLNTVWEDSVAPKVFACLDEMGVNWTSINVVRIGAIGGYFDPVVLWIRVEPSTLSGKDGNAAAFRCLDILKEFGITDVDVEIHEPVIR